MDVLDNKAVSQIRIDADRLNSTLQELAQIGKDPRGGTSRVAYSDEDIRGRAFTKQLMESAGLQVSIDTAGNIIGRREGADATKKPIAFGSHVDTVPNGGNYDGCLGVLSAIQAVRTINERQLPIDHSLEVICFANEEGGVMGSRAMIGALKPEAFELSNKSGLTVGEGIKRIGGDPDQLSSAVRSKGEMAAYVELHIEQGAVLDRKKVDIGVVEGIVGIEVWEVTVAGVANHAGTTPMNMRQDALVAASKTIIAINEVLKSTEGAHVGTVGKLELEPGAINIIPDKVRFTLELRDLSKDKVWALFEQIQKQTSVLAYDTDTEIDFRLLDMSNTPALADERIQNAIIESTTDLGLHYQKMPSGAGHDAQEIAQIAPIGMIFIPSIGGISHSPKEYSTPEDCANGANVLLNTILKLDKVMS